MQCVPASRSGNAWLRRIEPELEHQLHCVRIGAPRFVREGTPVGRVEPLDDSRVRSDDRVCFVLLPLMAGEQQLLCG